MGEPTSVSPATFEEQLSWERQNGGIKGDESERIRLEARRLRLQMQRRGELEPITPDKADIAVKDELTGRVRRARRGSTSSALGSFSVDSALGAESILGG